MSQRGRPQLALPAQQVRVTICLRAGEDEDLITFFAAIPPRMRATAIKTALRSGRTLATSSQIVTMEDEEDLGDFLLG